MDEKTEALLRELLYHCGYCIEMVRGDEKAEAFDTLEEMTYKIVLAINPDLKTRFPDYGQT
jgi:hypothetical protein